MVWLNSVSPLLSKAEICMPCNWTLASLTIWQNPVGDGSWRDLKKSVFISPATELGQCTREWLELSAQVTCGNVILASWESLPPLTALNYSSVTRRTTSEYARVAKATAAFLPTSVTMHPHTYTHNLTALLEFKFQKWWCPNYYLHLLTQERWDHCRGWTGYRCIFSCQRLHRHAHRKYSMHTMFTISVAPLGQNVTKMSPKNVTVWSYILIRTVPIVVANPLSKAF